MAAKLTVSLVLTALTSIASAPDAGRPFEPQPASVPTYGISPPSDDPQERIRYVEADDGVRIYTEAWLPAPTDGHVPPSSLPTILVYTPYWHDSSPFVRGWIDLLVPRGYAVALARVRGYGQSGGCADQHQLVEAEDGALVVEYLGRDAPWSNGTVGMVGLSYDAGTQLFTASAPSGRQYPWLKAIVPLAPFTASYYERVHLDGVPIWGDVGFTAFYTAGSAGLFGPSGLEDVPDRVPCQPEGYRVILDDSGDYRGPFAERDMRSRVSSIRAAMLTEVGFQDGRAMPKALEAVLDRLPPDIHRAGLFGPWRHGDLHDLSPYQPWDSGDGPPRIDWQRADWGDMVVAWLDQWVKGIDVGADEWPVAQVQDTTGQWRAMRAWSRPAGPPGQLALSAAGVLGATTPTGSSSYVEASYELRDRSYPPGTAAVFETAPVEAQLDLIGSMVADLWVTTDRPDGHIAVKVEVIGPDGTPVIDEARVVGARSLRHLDRLVDGTYFRQGEGRPAPVGQPINVKVRLNPTALVVPAGARVRLTVAGSVDSWDGFNFFRQESFSAGVPVPDTLGGPTELSGSFATITVLHDCSYPSVLRFVTRDEPVEWVDVREADESVSGSEREAPPATANGNGLAEQAVCGVSPVEPWLGL